MQTLHPSCIHILRLSLKRSVERTWIGSTFSINESAWSVMVVGSQSYVWSGRNTKLGDQGTLNVHNYWCILFYHVWRPTSIEIHWNNIWLRAWSHIGSHYTWGSVTTRHDFGGVLGRPLDTFFWALKISWSRLLAHVCEVVLIPTNLVITFKHWKTNSQHQRNSWHTTLFMVFLVPLTNVEFPQCYNFHGQY